MFLWETSICLHFVGVHMHHICLTHDRLLLPLAFACQEHPVSLCADLALWAVWSSLRHCKTLFKYSTCARRICCLYGNCQTVSVTLHVQHPTATRPCAHGSQTLRVGYAPHAGSRAEQRLATFTVHT